MVISELALGLLTNLLYDSAKKIPGRLFDHSSKAYKNAIKELNKKYRQSGTQIDIFLRQKNVKTAIKEYLENPNSSDLLKSLNDDFLASFSEENFSREYAKSILNTFFEILDHEIEKDSELRENLKTHLAKQTYQISRETNQGVHNLSQGFQEMSQRVVEIHDKVINGNKMDQNFGKELGTDFQESITKYIYKIIAEDSEFGISEVYTELSAKEILPISLKFHDEKSDRTRDYEVLELVKKEERLIISGESGAGKTTTLKWLNFIYATNYLEGKNESIPLYVELNSYIKGSFYDYVRIKAQGRGISKDILEILLKGETILFIDGFDLLSPTDGFFPYEEISNFVSEYSNCKFIISSRPDFFESIRSDFKVSELEKLTYEKILTFIYKCVPDMETRGILNDKILGDKQLKSLFTNPMLLSLAIRVAMERKSNTEDLLPSSRPEMYKAFISGLFAHVKTKGKSLCSDQIQIRNALTDLYFRLQCWNKVSCEYDEALNFVAKNANDPRFKETTSQHILEDCFKLGLLNRKDTEVEYGFHQSFQEYFAAIKLKEYFENGFDISEAFSQPKWEEVVIFTSEMLDSADKFIDSIILKGNLFLASKCSNKASDEIKEKICSLLADKMDSKYKLEKINVIESLERIGIIGIGTIAKALRDEDKDIRWNAAEALGNIRSEAAVQLLLDALKDENEDVRSNAANALGSTGSKKAVKPLIDALEDENEDVRKEAAEALGYIESEGAVQSLIDALRDENEHVRSAAAHSLIVINDEIAEKSLIDILNNENEDLSVRWDAVKALKDIESEKAVKALVNALKDKELRNISSLMLGYLESETAVMLLIEALKDEDLDLQHNARQALGSICSSIIKSRDSFPYSAEFRNEYDTVVQLLVNALKNEDINVRRGVTGVFLQIQYEIAIAVQPLINALKDQDEEVRMNAALALSHTKSEAAVQSLIGALKDKSESVRGVAAHALGEIKSKTAVKPLIDALNDKSEFVRSDVVGALGEIKSEAAVQPLIDLLKDEDVNEDEYADEEEYIDEDIDGDIRVSAAIALGKIKSEAAVQPLIDLLKDENENVRWSAVVALGDIKSETAVQPLIDKLNDEDEHVRSEAIRALESFKSETAVRQLINALNNESKNVRKGTAAVLGVIESELSITPLINLLKDENEDVRLSAAYSLCNFESKHAMQLLINVMIDENEPESMRESLLKTFMLLSSYPQSRVGQSETMVQLFTNVMENENEGVGSEIIVKLLGNVMTDKDKHVRLSVVEVLGNIESETAMQLLINSLKDEAGDVQRKTAAILKEICTVKNKKQLEELLKSEHEFSVNTAFEILEKIEKEEESKTILFESGLDINEQG